MHTNLTFDHLYIFVETLSIAARKMTLGFFKQRKKLKKLFPAFFDQKNKNEN